MAVSLVKGFISGGILVVTIIDRVGYVAHVEGVSMRPALNPSDFDEDYVFLSKWRIKEYAFDRGEVVSIISPRDPNVRIIKRIIGLPGDVISTSGYSKPYVRIPAGHCWVEGDNKGRSLDSNTYGPISMGLLLGRAQYILWPPSRWGTIPKRV